MAAKRIKWLRRTAKLINSQVHGSQMPSGQVAASKEVACDERRINNVGDTVAHGDISHLHAGDETVIGRLHIHKRRVCLVYALLNDQRVAVDGCQLLAV